MKGGFSYGRIFNNFKWIKNQVWIRKFFMQCEMSILRVILYKHHFSFLTSLDFSVVVGKTWYMSSPVFDRRHVCQILNQRMKVNENLKWKVKIRQTVPELLYWMMVEFHCNVRLFIRYPHKFVYLPKNPFTPRHKHVEKLCYKT